VREEELQFHSFLNSKLERMEWSAVASTHSAVYVPLEVISEVSTN